jgi:hypothetical protein
MDQDKLSFRLKKFYRRWGDWQVEVLEKNMAVSGPENKK